MVGPVEEWRLGPDRSKWQDANQHLLLWPLAAGGLCARARGVASRTSAGTPCPPRPLARARASRGQARVGDDPSLLPGLRGWQWTLGTWGWEVWRQRAAEEDLPIQCAEAVIPQLGVMWLVKGRSSLKAPNFRKTRLMRD